MTYNSWLLWGHMDSRRGGDWRVLVSLVVVLAGCSGKSSTPSSYQVGGTLTGLPSGASVVLRNNGGDDLTVSANGAFTFATSLQGGAAYAVTVRTAPAGQTCQVASGSGTVGAADVTSVVVTCTTLTYSVGGTVAGIPGGASLVLQNNGGDDLTVTADGSFTFTTRHASGAAYAVTVLTAPAGETCGITNGSGTMGSANVTSVTVTCSTLTYTVGGTVAGLVGGATMVLRVNGGDDLTVSANDGFTFATRLADGTTYAVTVFTAPAGQACAVTNGSGTVGSADVTSVAVACAPPTHTIGGTAVGVGASGLVLHNTFQNEDLTVPSGATSFTFTNRAPSGSAYLVTIGAQPAGFTCTLANAAGTVAGADVTNIAVTCSAALQAWNAPTTWGGYWADEPTMLQHAHFEVGGIVSDKGPTFAMTGGAEPTPYALGGFPAPVGTRYGGGPFPLEAVNYRASNASALDLAGGMLVCAIVKPTRNRPFDSFESPIIAKGVGDGKYTIDGGGWVLMQMHDAWCFHYEYKDGNGTTHQFMASIPGLFADQDFQLRMSPPMPLPADFEPDPSYVVVCGGRNGDDVVIAANAWDPSSAAAFSLALTQDQLSSSPFPAPYTLDVATTVPATIGGYHATSATLKAAAVSPTDSLAFGGQHTFDGYVFETAVWNESATPDNIRAKMQAFLGMASGTTYLRNREASSIDASAKLHTASRHAPRIDPSKGLLFGLQSWNRVSYWIDGSADYQLPMVFAAGENFALWNMTPASGAAGAPSVALSPTVHPPNDSPITPAQLVNLPPGASLSIALDQALPPLAGALNPTPHAHDRPTWDWSGPVQGQLWLRSVPSGTLRVQKTAPQPGHGGSCTVLGVAGTTCETKDIDLAGLTAASWTRVSLNGSFTADATANPTTGRTVNPGTLVLTNPGSTNLAFHVWGVQLTQLGGGGDLGAYDAAELMYDWNAARAEGGEPSADPFYPIDVLKLAPVTTNTALSGFCLGAEATMPDGLPWDAPFVNSRTAVAWVNDPASPTLTARVFVQGNDGSANAGKVCFGVTGASAPACASPPPAWSTGGAKHSLKGCMSLAGELRLYGDDALLATVVGGGVTPNLLGGTVLVGNGDARPTSSLTPWHGYVSRALVCSDTGTIATCR
jgi:predicted transcriptional regulator